MNLTLSFHSSRDQPLSDLVNGAAAQMFLTAPKPTTLTVSIMTSRGVSHLDNVTLTTERYKLPYEAPWGRDWSVLQLMAVPPRSSNAEPYEVTLTIEKKLD